MKIVVLVKRVADPDAKWGYTDDLTVDRTALEGRLSELDEYAVEQAVSLVENGSAAKITFRSDRGANRWGDASPDGRWIRNLVQRLTSSTSGGEI